MHLVTGDREQVATDLLYVNRHLAGSLDRIGVKVNVGFRRDLSDLLDGLKHSGLVIGHHYRNKFCVWPQRSLYVVRINLPVGADWNTGHLASGFLQALARIQHSMMLDGRGNDVVALARQAEESQV